MSDRNDEFDAYIDEVYETVNVMGINFPASDILFNCDPVAYRCYLSDWESEQEEEDEQPEVCSAEDAWEDVLNTPDRIWDESERDEFIRQYNAANNL